MIKDILIATLILHGLIHILGTLTEFDLVEIEDFSGKTLFSMSKTLKMALALLWTIAMIMFLVSAYGLYAETDWWKVFTITSVILSQVLIIIWWQDAKFGTIANIMIVGMILYYKW